MASAKDNTTAGRLSDALKQSRYSMKKCFSRLVGSGRSLMKPNNLAEEFEKVIQDKRERAKLQEGLIGQIIASTQEAVVLPPYVAFSVRWNPGFCEFLKVKADDLSVVSITPRDYLKLKETIYD